jgi:hypothetical protein
MFIRFSITTKRHSCCSSFPSGNEMSLFGSTSCGRDGLHRGYPESQQNGHPNIDPHHGLLLSFGHATVAARYWKLGMA